MRAAIHKISRSSLGLLWADQQGAAMVEYGLLVTLIALATVFGALFLGHQVSTTFSEIASYVAIYPQI